MVLCSVAQYNMVWYSIVWYSAVQHSMAWYSAVQHIMVWYRLMQQSAAQWTHKGGTPEPTGHGNVAGGEEALLAVGELPHPPRLAVLVEQQDRVPTE